MDNVLIEPYPTCHGNAVQPDESLDQTLIEIRSGRRLEKVVASIENFLNGQIDRLDKALDACQTAEKNDKVLQNVLAEFEAEKKLWEQQKDAELIRIKQAGDRLADGWKELERERRRLLDQQNG